MPAHGAHCLCPRLCPCAPSLCGLQQATGSPHSASEVFSGALGCAMRGRALNVRAALYPHLLLKHPLLASPWSELLCGRVLCKLSVPDVTGAVGTQLWSAFGC